LTTKTAIQSVISTAVLLTALFEDRRNVSIMKL
jgi:hypothetical protein